MNINKLNIHYFILNSADNSGRLINLNRKVMPILYRMHNTQYEINENIYLYNILHLTIENSNMLRYPIINFDSKINVNCSNIYLKTVSEQINFLQVTPTLKKLASTIGFYGIQSINFEKFIRFNYYKC